MNCDTVRTRLSLFLYGELSFDEEEQVEQHLGGCAACRREYEAEKAMHAALDSRVSDPSPALLAECRARLWRALEADASPAQGAGWRNRLAGFFTIRSAWLGPAGAVALVAVGFFGARLAPSQLPFAGERRDNGYVASRVRYLEPSADGRVRIGLEETRQRTVSGTLEDQRIRELLLAAARDPNDPGLRVDSVDLLRSKSATTDVRAALLHVLQHDPNAGVRLKALEGIKAFAAEPEVRGALAEVLLADDNPGVRTQVIELLVAHRDHEIVGTLQELLRKEDNDYIRLRTQRALQAMKASVETF
jgi:hypothetical protein